ncbi:MAG: hypothetical protein AzoDbin1_04624 [Azoarcus sp.]|nr:hypothetical protein [Azoarcus sp.]
MDARPQLVVLPLERLTRLAGEVTQKAARDAVAAGRAVARWKDGRIAWFGPGGRPLCSVPPHPGAATER